MLDLEDWPDLKSLHPRRNRSTSRQPKQSRNQTPRPREPSKTRHRPLDLDAHGECRVNKGVKRRRAFDDIDGAGHSSLPRKRRRLRRSLTTSRLSPDFATPATYVPSRKSLREGIWARQRVSGRDLLRKAAVFNSISKKKKAQRKIENRGTLPGSLRMSILSNDMDLETSKTTAPSSRLSSFSEYNVFDYEDDSSQDEEEEEDAESPTSIHSDFGKLQESISDTALSLDAYSFDSTSSLANDDIYTFDPGGKVLGMILENETRTEVSRAPKIG